MKKILTNKIPAEQTEYTAGRAAASPKPAFKVLLFRMWAAGAVCFFAAWGRTGAEEVGNAYSLDLIAGLIVIMIIGDLVIVNPLIRLASGKRVLAEGKKGAALFGSGLLHIVKVTALMLLIVGTYYLLNVLFIRLFGMDEKAVPLPLEPVFFGILYGLYYTAFEAAGKAVFRRPGSA